MRSHLVAVVAYDDLCTFEFACAAEIFSVRWPGIDVPWYPVRRVRGDAVPAARDRRTCVYRAALAAPPRPGGHHRHSRLAAKTPKCARARSATLFDLHGAFVLAATGLLDGKPATTHWIHVALLQERYPEIEVRSNDLYVDTGRIITSAGSAAGLEMMLHLVRRDHGAKIANLVAQGLVIPAHREGGQAQFLSTRRLAKRLASDRAVA